MTVYLPIYGRHMTKLTPANMNLFKRIAEDLRLLALLLGDYLKGRYRRISPVSGIIFILAAAYLLIPTDLIGDFITEPSILSLRNFFNGFLCRGFHFVVIVAGCHHC
jgi:hypothetical protein